jgi:hypothetical protein
VILILYISLSLLFAMTAVIKYFVGLRGGAELFRSCFGVVSELFRSCFGVVSELLFCLGKCFK